MNWKIVALIMLMGMITLGGGLFGEENSPVAPVISNEVNDAHQGKSADQAKKIEKEKEKYPQLEYPPGFYEGVVLIGFMTGKTVAPSGSFLQHEKVYDQRMRDSIATGAVQNALPAIDVGYLQAEYVPEEIGQLDIEYGAWEHIGMGLSVFQYRIRAVRQDSFRTRDSYGHMYNPVPRERTIYQGNAVTMMTTFHPISRRMLDPYLALRFGFVGFTGEANAGLEPDPYRTGNKLRNGLGSVVGGGLGVNIFLGRTMGIKAEASYNRKFLKSDVFDRRTLNSYHAQIGVFFNYNTLARRMRI